MRKKKKVDPKSRIKKPKPSDEKYAKTIVELADRLGVARQTIGKWRQLKGAPKPLSNGLHDIEAWKIFKEKNNLKAEPVSENDDLRTRKMLVELRQAELKLSVLEGAHVPLDRVREVWGIHISQVRRILEDRLLNELPPILAALDAISIREKLREVLDDAYKSISEKNAIEK